nr:hypothetical protein Iba_chr04dCG7400 [Ipomoea batatas]
MTMAGLLQYKFFPTDFLIFPQKNSSIPKDTIHQLSPPGKPQQEQAAFDESKVLGNGGETMKGKMVKEAEHGAGGVEHIGRNSKLVRHVNHGRGEHVDYESAQAYATDGFFNAFSDSRLERVYGDHRGGRNVGGIDGDRLVQWECHELQSPSGGLGLDERSDFEVEW